MPGAVILKGREEILILAAWVERALNKRASAAVEIIFCGFMFSICKSARAGTKWNYVCFIYRKLSQVWTLINH